MNYNLGKIVSLDFVKSNHSTKIDLKLKKKIQSNNCYFRIQVRSSCLSYTKDRWTLKRCIKCLLPCQFQTSPSLTPQFRPVVDGYVLPDTPERLIQSGAFRAESVMTGATSDEGLIAGSQLTISRIHCLVYRKFSIICVCSGRGTP